MTTKSYTAAIIGGGPAGSQCALWLKMMGLHPVIIESTDHLGGLQSLSPYQNQWIAGLMNVSGRELAERIQQHLLSKDVPVIFDSEVTSCKEVGDGFMLMVGNTHLHTRFIVMATGSIQRHDDQKTKSATDQSEHDSAFSALDMSSDAGWQANLPKVFNEWKARLLNQDGFIITDEECETPVKSIFAIGEAANRMQPCVVTSMADGVVAAKAIQRRC
jgi:thioredoxin reductase